MGTSIAAGPLLSLAVTVTSEQHIESVLRKIVEGLASQPGVALVRIWLLPSVHIPNAWQEGSHSQEGIEHLRLVASAGNPIKSPGEDWSYLQGQFARFPLNIGKVGQVAADRHPILIKDFAPQDSWVVRPEWAEREEIRSFAGHPLIFQEKLLGVIGLFSRRPLGEQEFTWLGLFANHAAVAIANAILTQELRGSEAYLAEAQRLSHTGSFGWSLSNGEIFWSEETFQIFEYDRGTKVTVDLVLQRVHPEDRVLVQQTIERAPEDAKDFDFEHRLLMPDGSVKHLRVVAHALSDESGSSEFVGAVMDITVAKQAEDRIREDRKQAEERLRQENVALREEIDKASMFEEIVGTSPALKSALSRISKVAPSDSTVLITGETGTGKELIARAIHRRSPRSSRALVSVNFAAIPHDLIASELFGHEKGAFTGATQRHIGRFELAGGGTIFLDEIGELTPETQIALLRVLQEHEFERVGGNRSIRTDVRVIAATNRDLQAAIDAGTFRSDLFYRLNVFPIDIPALRERTEDIPMLVEYFIDRYARKAGKNIRCVNKKTVDLLQSYPWPGNIRELQNVIERSVIVCDSEIFSVDESWVSRKPLADQPSKNPLGFSRALATQEKQMIEAALRECAGRVYGTSGAAARLGMPRSTLESKIRSLHINKSRFKM